MIKKKIVPLVDLNYWLKHLNKNGFELTNQNSVKVTKILGLKTFCNKKTISFYKFIVKM